MSYDKLVYGIGKLYGKHLRENPSQEFPEFDGLLSDLLDEESLNSLGDMHGEYVVAYNDGQGTSHFIRLYVDAGTFEVAGTPEIPNLFGLSSTSFQD